MIKIEIKTMLGALLFSYEAEDNTLIKTAEEAVKQKKDLRGADLRGADLRGADLTGAYLTVADLRGAYLTGADLRGADLTGADLRGADLTGADLRGADILGIDLHGCELKNLSQEFINLCSRDLLFVFQHLRAELPFLREELLAGRVNGTQYEGECACLIGTMAKKQSLEGEDALQAVCNMIPYYNKSASNPGETWFLAIHQGDKPETNEFAAHVLTLIDKVLQEENI